jgi:hypothetical protein
VGFDVQPVADLTGSRSDRCVSFGVLGSTGDGRAFLSLCTKMKFRVEVRRDMLRVLTLLQREAYKLT